MKHNLVKCLVMGKACTQHSTCGPMFQTPEKLALSLPMLLITLWAHPSACNMPSAESTWLIYMPLQYILALYVQTWCNTAQHDAHLSRKETKAGSILAKPSPNGDQVKGVSHTLQVILLQLQPMSTALARLVRAVQCLHDQTFCAHCYCVVKEG